MDKRITCCSLLGLALILTPEVTQARWLDVKSGRFLTMDSYEGHQEDAKSLHTYAYAQADPVDRTDPSGHESISTVMVDIGVITILQAVGAVAPGQLAIKPTAVVVHGDPGPSGGLFEMAAETHRRELRSGTFWKTPVTAATDVKVVRATTVDQFVAQLVGKSVVYVAYFGHSGPKALYFGWQALPDTNLSDAGGESDTPVASIPVQAFAPNAEVRLFGCKAGLGTGSIAQRLASHLKKSVWAYTNPGGSLFTQDGQLGHGLRSVTQADITGGANISYNVMKDTWLVPANGKPTMTEFRP